LHLAALCPCKRGGGLLLPFRIRTTSIASVETDRIRSPPLVVVEQQGD